MGYLLKLLCAIYGLHQALVKFKQEVIDSDCLKATGNGYTSADDAQTIWIKQSKYHDLDCLVMLFILMIFCITLITKLCIRKHFKFKTGSVCFYLGYQIKVDKANFTVELNQSDYIDKLLDCFEMTNCTSVSTSIVNWHSKLAHLSRQL